MEIGLSYIQNPVQQFPVSGYTSNLSFDLFKLTSEKCQPLSNNKIRTLNELCEELPRIPTLFGIGFSFRNSSFSSPSFRSVAEANITHENLSSIPIYNEVL